jgi:hypothetical protein
LKPRLPRHVGEHGRQILVDHRPEHCDRCAEHPGKKQDCEQLCHSFSPLLSTGHNAQKRKGFQIIKIVFRSDAFSPHLDFDRNVDFGDQRD